jgi:hypothetical protein
MHPSLESEMRERQKRGRGGEMEKKRMKRGNVS